LEYFLGIDYNTLEINPKYELIPSKPEYEDTPGACKPAEGTPQPPSLPSEVAYNDATEDIADN
jgi:hypothetical protein